jgi:hypothetical protein
VLVTLLAHRPTGSSAPGEAAPLLAAARNPELVAGALLCVAVVWTTVFFPVGSGGREPFALTKDVVPVVLALVALRPWRVVRPWIVASAALIAGAALVVCAVTPPGWFGANRAASYGVAAATFVAVAAYARRSRRAYLVATLVVVAGGVQFFRALVPWWGSRDSATAMIGTFYWHNQFGAFLLAPAILGLTLALAGRPPFRFAGWIVTPFAVAGVVFSSSRGSALALIAGWLLIGVAVVRSKRVSSGGRARGPLIRRWLAMSLLAGAVTFGLAGPPLFSTWHAPWAGAQARAATGQTLEQNGGVRIYLWREALIVFEHHPVAGAGFGAMSDEAVKLTPSTWPRSPLAHNDYLQPFAEGGLLLGLPMLFGCGAIAVFLGRRLWALLRRGFTDPLRVGVVVAALVTMAHAGIDFDWSYPALFATSAAVAGLACGSATAVSRHRQRSRSVASRAVAAGAVVALISTVLVGAVAGRHGGLSLVYRSHAAQDQAHSQAVSP